MILTTYSFTLLLQQRSFYKISIPCVYCYVLETDTAKYFTGLLAFPASSLGLLFGLKRFHWEDNSAQQQTSRSRRTSHISSQTLAISFIPILLTCNSLPILYIEFYFAVECVGGDKRLLLPGSLQCSIATLLLSCKTTNSVILFRFITLHDFASLQQNRVELM